MARIGYGGGGGLSRQPVKLDTASANFFAGMAGVQAMRQQQEQHEQALVQNEEKLQLAKSADRRANRQLAIEEKQAYREEVAFQAGAVQAGAKVTSWNGREMPRWGSRSLQNQWQTLDDMKRDIARRRNAGQDVTSQEIAFASLSTQYENLYASEKYKSDASAAATGVAGLYQELNLQPEADIQQLLDSVMSAPPQGGEPGAVGPTATQVPPDAIGQLQAEKRRLMQYRAERQQREALALDLGSMQEIFGQLRSGRVPDGFTIDQSLAKTISELAISDYDEGDILTGQNHALMELHRALSGAFVGDIDPWAVDSDVNELAKRVRRLKGLFGMLQNTDSMDEYNLQKDVEVRMQNERKLFREREKMSATLEDMYRTEGIPEESMSPYMMFAKVHRGQSLQGDGMQYDDSAEYGQLWSIVDARIKAIGGPPEEAIKILDQRWREGAQDRELLAQMPSYGFDAQRKGDNNADYYEAVAQDIVGQTKQMNEKINSPVISDDLLQLELTHPDDRSMVDQAMGVAAQAIEGAASMAASAMQALAGQTPTGLKHLGGQYYQRYNSGDGDQDEKIRVALQEAGISEDVFFSRREGEVGVDVIGTLLGPGGIQTQTDVEGRPMTILEFINRDPKKGARLLHALQYPKSEGGQYNRGRIADPNAEPGNEYSSRYADRGVKEEEVYGRAPGKRTAIRATGEDRQLAAQGEEIYGLGARTEGGRRTSLDQLIGVEEAMREPEDPSEGQRRREEAGGPTGTGRGPRRASEIGSGMEEYMRPDEMSRGEDLRQRVGAGAVRPLDDPSIASDRGAQSEARRLRSLPSAAKLKSAQVETLDDFLRLVDPQHDAVKGAQGQLEMDPDEKQALAIERLQRLKAREQVLLRQRSKGGKRQRVEDEIRSLRRIIGKVERLLPPL